MRLHRNERIADGVYGMVFLKKDQNRVYKLFKKSVSWDTNISDDDRIRTFEFELAAYKIASGNASLRKYIPEFHGQISVKSVIDWNGAEIAGGFLLDHCYCLEYVEGYESKILAVMDRHKHIDRIVKEFHAGGIKYMEDATVFFPAEEAKIKIIDIATRNLGGDSSV